MAIETLIDLPPDALIARVQYWQQWVQSHQLPVVSIIEEDPSEFAAALLGSWRAGANVVLPSDLRTAMAPAVAPAPSIEFSPGARLALRTSGTTGAPVLISKRFDQLSTEIQTLERTFGPMLSERSTSTPAIPSVLTTVSHQHLYGLLFTILWPLSVGRSLPRTRLCYAENIHHELSHTKAILVSSPAHLRRLPETLDWPQVAHNVCAIFSSGGPLPIDAVRACERHFLKSPIEIFGSTETGGIAWYEARSNTRKSWIPFDGVQWRISAETGCLEISSPHLETTLWHETSDIAVPLESGGFELQGRSDRIVKVEEKRISLAAIEQALVDTKLVLQARALVLQMPGRAEVGIVAVLAGDVVRNELPNRLRRALLGVVDQIAVPRRFRFVDELPVNSMGKATQTLLQNLFSTPMPSPRWLERSTSHAIVKFDIAADLAPLSGHFPEAPIVPGVAQVDWAIALARDAFQLHGTFRRIEVLKFQQLLRPRMVATLQLNWNRDSMALTFRLTSNDRVCSSGRVVFGDTP